MPVRLLLVSGSLAGGGAERVASTMLARLDRARVTPSVALLRGPVTYPVPDDVEVTILGKTHAAHVPRTVLRLRRLIEAQRPDVVLSMIAFVNAVTGAALIGNPTPWIARVGAPPRTEGKLRPVLARLYPRADAVIVNAGALATEVPSARVLAIPNPTDVGAIVAAAGPPAPASPPVILAVGRLSPEKRLDRLIAAVDTLRHARPCALWLCGDGASRPALEADVARRGLGDHVRFLGERDDPYRVMRQATVYALSSAFEGLPNALLEAAVLGLPCVATRCGGPEAILTHDRTGLLVDEAGLAPALARLLDDAALRSRLGTAAAADVRARFDVPVVMPRLEAVITQVARRR